MSIFNNYVVPSLPASLSHHLDWEMDKLVSKHRTFNTRSWTSCLIDALRHNSPTGCAPNEKSGMTASGILANRSVPVTGTLVATSRFDYLAFFGKMTKKFFFPTLFSLYGKNPTKILIWKTTRTIFPCLWSMAIL